MSKSCKIRALPGEALICHNPSTISQTYGGLWWASILNKITYYKITIISLEKACSFILEI